MARNIKSLLLLCTFFVVISLLVYFLVSHDSRTFSEVEPALYVDGKRVSSTVIKHESENTSETRGIDVKPVLFLIFDALEHKGDLQFLNNLSSKWTVIVVNSAGENQLESCRRCQMVDEAWSRQFLSLEIAYQTWHQLPGYAQQKASAILYALWNSAEWLYVTDSRFLPDEDTLLSICSHKAGTGPVYSGPNVVFEPCDHFMDPYTWHGLEKVNQTSGSFRIKSLPSDGVYMVVNSCYRKHMDSLSWKKGIDTQAPRPHVMPGTFSSIDFGNVIVSRRMAWTLVASLLLRSYESQNLQRQRVMLNLMIQRTIWETNGTIGFVPTSRFPEMPECPSCETNKILQSIGQTHLGKVSNWRGKPENNLVKCLEQLATEFAPHLLPTNSKETALEVLLGVWLDLMSSPRFPIAPRVPLTAARLAQKHDGIPLQLSPAKSMHNLSSTLATPQNVFADLCRTKDGKQYPHYIPTDHMISDILLVVVFNFPHLVANIPKLEYVYGRHFKNILYCAGSMAEFHKLYASKYPNNPVSFSELPVHRGIAGYRCMTAATQIGYQVSGYLQMSDDVILNVWNLQALPRLMPWFQKSMKVGHIDRKTVPCIWVNENWLTWRLESGQAAVLKAHQSLWSLRASPETGEQVSAFLQNLHNVTGCHRCVIYEASDIFYLPTNMAASFTYFSDIFSNFRVHLEITIPTVLTGLATDAGIYRLRGTYLWYGDRERYMHVHTQFAHFLHPWKFNRLAKPEAASFYCREVIDPIDRDLRTHDRNDKSH